MWRQTWDRLSLYLPVLLMGLLALGTWWLVRNAPTPLSPAAATAPGDEPDYTMRSFSVRHFDESGRLQSEVRGEEARHYPRTNTVEIDRVRMRSIGPDGRVTVATADRALSNADGSEVQLFGNAVVTRQPLPPRPGQPPQPVLEFRGEFLHAFTRAERVTSDRPVVLTRGADRFTADRLEYDHVAQVLQLQGRVQGVLQPGRAR